MVSRSKPEKLKAALMRRAKDDLGKLAVELYCTQDPASDARKSLRKVCQEVSDMHFVKKKVRIHLSHQMLSCHIHRGCTLSEHNTEKRLETPEEAGVREERVPYEPTPSQGAC